MKTPVPSSVEKKALEESGFPLRMSDRERIGVITVPHFPALGRLAALRFLEWVQQNPGGVAALPTGKTPEHFIGYVTHYLRTWTRAETRRELEKGGLDPGPVPDMKSLHFVQIDEFYPMDPAQHNSFHYYVNKYYIQGFGLDPGKALFIDCSKIGVAPGTDLKEIWPGETVDLTLRIRHPGTVLESRQKKVLEAVDQWCHTYEERIRSLGGIGFFLGGIGPDGHIAFNIRGSDHFSTTRLTPINYETQASAAADLGGMEVARKRHAITIGLATITRNPAAVAVILAAGEAKAGVVRDAVMQEPNLRYPGTALQKLSEARFYLTNGAARDLPERRIVRIQGSAPDMRSVERIVIDLAVARKKTVLQLKAQDFKADSMGARLLAEMKPDLQRLIRDVHDRLVKKVELGCRYRTKTAFLHTAPHHDDIMLGYFPHVVRHIRDASNRHTFTYMTSGFNAVTNLYALGQVENLLRFIRTSECEKLHEQGYFSPADSHCRNRDVWQYLDGVAANEDSMKREGEARRFMRNLIEIFEEDDPDNLEHRAQELVNYFETQYAGKKDIAHIQKLKGMIREWEADCLWGYLGFDSSSVRHLRLGFYQGDLFTEEPTFQRDVRPIVQLMRQVCPDVVTVALDPEASGPDTHYKVLQAVAEALRQYEKESKRSDLMVLGYRNVWYRFHPAEANLYVPVSLNMFAVLQNAFMNAFVSQSQASFPSHEYDGPFSGFAQNIQTRQYQVLKRCLGREYFNEHPSPLIRATRGFIFIQELTLDAFYELAREIREKTEA